MKWFRLWHDMVDNPKIQSLPNKLFKAYINTLCIASANDPRGSLPNLTKYAFKMRVKPGEAQKILEEFENLRLVSNENSVFSIHDWEEHQKNSDNIAVRVQKHRGKCNVTGNDTETETETKTPLFIEKKEEIREEKKEETEKEPPNPRKRGKREDDPAFEEVFWPKYPKKDGKQAAKIAWAKIKPDEDLLNAILKAIELQAKTKEAKILAGVWCAEWPNPATWLNGKRWEDEVNPQLAIVPNHSHNTGTSNGTQPKLNVTDYNARMLAQYAINQSKDAASHPVETGRVFSDIEYSVEGRGDAVDLGIHDQPVRSQVG